MRCAFPPYDCTCGRTAVTGGSNVTAEFAAEHGLTEEEF